ncbi:MAG TPA: helix-turn-helix transcriptional regulator [Clostridiaceae bacterium]|nr:helix-turn-helix transcriptional regulator [Clostridiaceae bacterium]
MSYIRYLRKKSHLTQSQLADILGVTQTSVSQWESGRNFPDIKTARRMAEFFDTTLDQIMSHSSAGGTGLRRAEHVYSDKVNGGLALQDLVELEVKRKIMVLLDQLSVTSKMRILERVEAYLEVESAMPAQESAEAPVQLAQADGNA